MINSDIATNNANNKPEKPINSSSEEDLYARTRRMSILEGNFGVLSAIISDNYMVPFALALGSTPFQAGILSSSGGIISPLGQLISSRIMESHNRKGIIFFGILGLAFLMFLFLIVAIISAKIAIGTYITWVILGLFVLYAFNGGVMTPPWFSLMGDVVPEDGRGRYFAKRNLINNIISIVGVILIAFLLDAYTNQGQIMIGFCFVFLLGFITRIFSFFFFTKHYYPPFHFQPIDRVSFHQFVKELPKSNFGHFTIFVTFLILGQWIAGPFFTVYMLQDLDFSYFLLILVNISTSVFGLLFFPLFGKLGDKYGNVFLMRIGAIIIPILPFMWLFIKSPWGLIFGPQLLSGFAWTAFNLATSNFIYDNIPSHKRGEYVAFYNLFLGFGIISGGLVGSLIIQFLPTLPMNQYHIVFLLSCFVRLGVVIVLISSIKEIRSVKARPIFNIKNLAAYRWLNDILMREHGKRTNENGTHNGNGKHHGNDKHHGNN